MSEDEERARRVAEVIRKTAVLELAGMHEIQIREQQPYGEGGTFDLYLANTAAPAPTVLFVYGFPDPRFAQGLRQMGAYTSWGRLLAASGMNAVGCSYGPGGSTSSSIAHDAVTDVPNLYDYCEAHCPDRDALPSCSLTADETGMQSFLCQYGSLCD